MENTAPDICYSYQFGPDQKKKKNEFLSVSEYSAWISKDILIPRLLYESWEKMYLLDDFHSFHFNDMKLTIFVSTRIKGKKFLQKQERENLLPGSSQYMSKILFAGDRLLRLCFPVSVKKISPELMKVSEDHFKVNHPGS